MSKYEAPKYENYQFPLLANIGGWCISLSTLAPLFIFAIYRIIVNKTVSFYLNFEILGVDPRKLPKLSCVV